MLRSETRNFSDRQFCTDEGLNYATLPAFIARRIQSPSLMPLTSLQMTTEKWLNDFATAEAQATQVLRIF